MAENRIEFPSSESHSRGKVCKNEKETFQSLQRGAAASLASSAPRGLSSHRKQEGLSGCWLEWQRLCKPHDWAPPWHWSAARGSRAFLLSLLGCTSSPLPRSVTLWKRKWLTGYLGCTDCISFCQSHFKVSGVGLGLQRGSAETMSGSAFPAHPDWLIQDLKRKSQGVLHCIKHE